MLVSYPAIWEEKGNEYGEDVLKKHYLTQAALGTDGFGSWTVDYWRPAYLNHEPWTISHQPTKNDFSKPSTSITFYCSQQELWIELDFFFAKIIEKWQQEYKQLRSIVLDCGLEEELKSGTTLLCFQRPILCSFTGFKEYCALLFFKEPYWRTQRRCLIQQTENVQAARQARFTHVKEIVQLEKFWRHTSSKPLKGKSRAESAHEENRAFPMPDEFKTALKKKRKTETPGLLKPLHPEGKRAYLLHFFATQTICHKGFENWKVHSGNPSPEKDWTINIHKATNIFASKTN